jgi:carboxyl-terminal processing protease
LIQAFQAPSVEERTPLNHIGVTVQKAENGYRVTAALEGYPAHQEGIERGDTIVRVNGEPYHPVYSFNAHDTDGRGFTPKPSEYRVEYERLGDLETVNTVPVFENLYDSYRTATFNSMQAFPLGNKTIAYVRFWGLSRATSDLFSLEVAMSGFTNSDGLIIDLRNSYGYLSSNHLDMFIRNSRVSFTASNDSNSHAAIESSFASTANRVFTKPIVVLINAQTRGGAELFAHALSKLGRVTTLGEISAGEIGAFTVNENTLRYLPAEQTLIDGQPFEDVGVAPKQVIAFPYTQGGRSDPQFEAAVDILLGTI